MSLVEIHGLTKDYGRGRGVFDIDLQIEEGEAFGFVGTNGAGKTTTIRHLMGFLQPHKGSCTIRGLDCWALSEQVKQHVGYVPGEIAFPDEPSGFAFLERQAAMIGAVDAGHREHILDMLQLDASADLKRMSKGMKQKTAIVAAFMHDPPILVLDEPTTGLDPLMRASFLDLLEEERGRGKTIFMSSHMFNELETTCDRVAMIKDGVIVDVASTAAIRHYENKTYKIEFLDAGDYSRFQSEGFELSEKRDAAKQVFANVNDAEIDRLVHVLKGYRVKFLTEIKYSLEQYFNSIYKKETPNVQ
ncbi:MAG: ATP-binding cassette domain-containing protein [Thermoleophilia bacterium]|nr:ATP-binding cassette domain-containing protein [Thermoleophilia bacterium]